METSHPLQPIAKRFLRQNLAEQLMVAIFRRELGPSERLVEEELAARFGVSRTPVREAFAELAGLGILAIRPGRGAVIRNFGPEQLKELYDVRGILEMEATRLACAKTDRPSLTTLVSRIEWLLANPNRDAAWSEAAIAADQQLHDLIAASCGNQRLAEEIGRYRKLAQAVRQGIGQDVAAQELAAIDHLEILSRLLARNAGGAAMAMKKHIADAAKAAINGMFTPQAHATAK